MSTIAASNLSSGVLALVGVDLRYGDACVTPLLFRHPREYYASAGVDDELQVGHTLEDNVQPGSGGGSGRIRKDQGGSGRMTSSSKGGYPIRPSSSSSGEMSSPTPLTFPELETLVDSGIHTFRTEMDKTDKFITGTTANLCPIEIRRYSPELFTCEFAPHQIGVGTIAVTDYLFCIIPGEIVRRSGGNRIYR